MNNIGTYLIICFALALTVISAISLNALLIAFSITLLLVMLGLYKLWYVVESILFKHTNLIQVVGDQQLGGDRSTAIRVTNDGFVATAVALLMGEVREVMDRTKIESIITHSGYPFKFVVCVEKLDANKLVDKLQTKRNMKEIELSKASEDRKRIDLAKISLLKREIEQIEQDIKRISIGRPLRLARYLATSAKSGSRFAAEERAKSQIKELASEFGALLDGSSKVLLGDELLEALELDSMVL